MYSEQYAEFSLGSHIKVKGSQNYISQATSKAFPQFS